MAWTDFRTAILVTPALRRRQPRSLFAGMNSCIEPLEPRLALTIDADEQLFVYLLNKIRHDPQAYDEEAGLGGILDGVEGRQPLAVNDDLFASAEFHAEEMADNNYFGHQSDVTGGLAQQDGARCGLRPP